MRIVKLEFRPYFSWGLSYHSMIFREKKLHLDQYKFLYFLVFTLKFCPIFSIPSNEVGSQLVLMLTAAGPCSPTPPPSSSPSSSSPARQWRSSRQSSSTRTSSSLFSAVVAGSSQGWGSGGRRQQTVQTSDHPGIRSADGQKATML